MLSSHHPPAFLYNCRPNNKHLQWHRNSVFLRFSISGPDVESMREEIHQELLVLFVNCAPSVSVVVIPYYPFLLLRYHPPFNTVVTLSNLCCLEWTSVILVDVFNSKYLAIQISIQCLLPETTALTLNSTLQTLHLHSHSLISVLYSHMIQLNSMLYNRINKLG